MAQVMIIEIEGSPGTKESRSPQLSIVSNSCSFRSMNIWDLHIFFQLQYHLAVIKEQKMIKERKKKGDPFSFLPDVYNYYCLSHGV